MSLVLRKKFVTKNVAGKFIFFKGFKFDSIDQQRHVDRFMDDEGNVQFICGSDHILYTLVFNIKNNKYLYKFKLSKDYKSDESMITVIYMDISQKEAKEFFSKVELID
jgi:hypothetical protein